MAKSPSHKWGQIIGAFLETTFEKELSKFAKKHKLFFDKKGERKARKGKKVSWVDSFGNAHDLAKEETLKFLNSYSSPKLK